MVAHIALFSVFINKDIMKTLIEWRRMETYGSGFKRARLKSDLILRDYTSYQYHRRLCFSAMDLWSGD